MEVVVVCGQLSQVAIETPSAGYRSFYLPARQNDHLEVAPLHVAEDSALYSGVHTTAALVLLRRLVPREVLQSLQVALLEPRGHV
jgi:hypothetical protein